MKQAAVIFTFLALFTACSLEDPIVENADSPEPVQVVATDEVLPEEGVALATQLTLLQPKEVASAKPVDALGPVETVLAEIKILEEDLQKVPFDADIRFILGSEYWRIKKFDEAVGYFEETLRLDPEYHSAHWSLSLLFNQRGQGADAILHMKAAERIFLEDENTKSVAEARKNLRGYYAKYEFVPEDFEMPKGFFARLFN